MSFTLEVHPAAAREAARARRWYSDIDVELGVAFAAELRRVFERAAERPLASAAHPPDARRLGVRGFPYAVVFRSIGSVVRVLAVMHEHRRPGYWSRRR